jgi:hypothetical protein
MVGSGWAKKVGDVRFAVVGVSGPPAPRGLRTRARRLWRDFHEGSELGPEASVLVVEACRLVQRLDDLDARLRDAWSVEVAREARLTAGQLKALVAELRQHDVGSVLPPVGAGPVEEVDPIDELGARRKDRIADSAG